MTDEREREPLKDETNAAIEEVRMVLPGVQALFGFQMIAIFSERFEKLSESLQKIHLTALVLIATTIVLVMAPAAFHRIAERGWVSRRLINYTSNFLTAGMAVLALGLTLDVGLVSNIVLRSVWLGTIIGAVLFALLSICWFIIPVTRRIRQAR